MPLKCPPGHSLKGRKKETLVLALHNNISWQDQVGRFCATLENVSLPQYELDWSVLTHEWGPWEMWGSRRNRSYPKGTALAPGCLGLNLPFASFVSLSNFYELGMIIIANLTAKESEA